MFNEEKFPSLPSQNQSTEEFFKTFPNLTPMTIEETSNNSGHQENHSNIESISNYEDEDVFVDALEQQPQRIRVIGPRHPTLISSEINSDNILPFTQRQPRVNLTNLTNHTPKNYSKAMSSSNKESWKLAIHKELVNIDNLNVWTL
ncbi:hypothetical protein O181_131832 [Austropuccinia psidii MF-1]|uniref:Uncharacterized protein n=1 Tax=Austropuccinia psidii MF-1 TaxID=1389203 RepID=A0A9Q3QDJ6_9BASI|nr:hypothetical protein [Austropuccinia psidii MF-1]